MPLNWRFTVGAKDCGSLVCQGPITSAFQITNAVNTITRDGYRWIVDAHKDDGKCYIVQSDELLSAFLELEKALL